MDTSGEMSWEDACAALRLGARPEEVVSRARGLFRALPPSPPPAAPAPPAAARGVAGLYRTLPEAGGATLQLCFLRPPLPVLEAAERDLLPLAAHEPRFDTELTFDVLALFAPRVIAPVHEALHALSAADLSVARSSDAAALAPPPGAAAPRKRARAPMQLRALGSRLAQGAAVAEMRTLAAREWAVAYPAFARAAPGTQAHAALSALREVGSEQLGRFLLASVVPALVAAAEGADVVEQVVAEAADAARMEKCSVREVRDFVRGVQDAGGYGRSNAAVLHVLQVAMGLQGG